MAPSRHLVCGNCSSWIQFDSSGCTISWAEMRKSTRVFTCKGCTEVAMLVGEVEDLRKMMESLTGTGRKKRRNRGSRGITGRSGEGKGEERRREDTRKQFHR